MNQLLCSLHRGFKASGLEQMRVILKNIFLRVCCLKSGKLTYMYLEDIFGLIVSVLKLIKISALTYQPYVKKQLLSIKICLRKTFNSGYIL